MPIITVENLTKEFRLGQLESLRTTLLNQMRRLTGQPLEQSAPFKTLDDVSFRIEELETWGDRVLDAATLTEVLGHPGH